MPIISCFPSVDPTSYVSIDQFTGHTHAAGDVASGILPIPRGGTGNATGQAASAVKLTTARTIGLSGGVTGTATSFNGSANISIPITKLDASYLDGVIDGGTF